MPLLFDGAMLEVDGQMADINELAPVILNRTCRPAANISMTPGLFLPQGKTCGGSLSQADARRNNQLLVCGDYSREIIRLEAGAADKRAVYIGG